MGWRARAARRWRSSRALGHSQSKRVSVTAHARCRALGQQRRRACTRQALTQGGARPRQGTGAAGRARARSQGARA
eukprot:1472896-Pleurochrysis_carterae.AAC.1